jgi:hypothetical protein
MRKMKRKFDSRISSSSCRTLYHGLTSKQRAPSAHDDSLATSCAFFPKRGDAQWLLSGQGFCRSPFVSPMPSCLSFFGKRVALPCRKPAMVLVVCYIVLGSVGMGIQHILRNAQHLFLSCKRTCGIYPMRVGLLKGRNLGTPSGSTSIHRSRDRKVTQDYPSLYLSSKSLVTRIELSSF